MRRSFSRMLSAENSSKLSAQSPAWSKNARPAATRASSDCSDRASPANTSGGIDEICFSDASRAPLSGQSGCWPTGRSCHDDGDHGPRVSGIRSGYRRRKRQERPVFTGRSRSTCNDWCQTPIVTSDGEDALGVVAEASHCTADEAAGRFGSDAELLADFAEALALAVDEPEAGLDGEPCPRVERAEQLVEQLAVDQRHHVIFGSAVTVGHQVAEGGVAVVADRLVEADRCGEAVQLGVGLVEGLAVAGGLTQRSAQAGGAVAGDADEAGLLVERPADGLTDPEGGVGGELEATAPVELVDGVLETQVARLDEVEQVHALGQGVAASDADHEAQVGADEPVLGLGGFGHLTLERHAALAVVELFLCLTASLDDARQLTLVLGGQERDLADVVQVETNGVVHDVSYNRSCS